MLSTSTWIEMLLNASKILKENKLHLCELDAVIGDGDHGITIEKIGEAIQDRVKNLKVNDTIKSINDDLGVTFMNIRGGSAGPLWGTIFEGMAEGIDNKEELTLQEIKSMFNNAKENLCLISTAQIGQKTLVDALYPAIEEIQSKDGELKELFLSAYICSKKGAEDTKNYIAKFGRAKSIGDRSLGCIDPGAESISLLFKGLYEGIK